MAYGVLYRRHGIIQIAHASKEVIVSAGTIGSPIMLMKSGIGDKEVLEKAKVIDDEDSILCQFARFNSNTTSDSRYV